LVATSTSSRLIGLYYVDSALATAETNCIVAIEDIDTSWTVQAREELLNKLKASESKDAGGKRNSSHYTKRQVLEPC
jgi:hypothetical protein